MRKLVWASAFLVLFASAGSAAIVLEEAPEQLIEGHTVFVTIGLVPNLTAEEEFAAAVAVLVRDRTQNVFNTRFPGVIWFNDQYLVDPEIDEDRKRARDRYPCTGAVIAVNRGDPVDFDEEGRWTLVNATYNESYFITDPNDHNWQVDLWDTANGTHAWTVAIGGGMGEDANAPDDGKCRGSAYSDGRGWRSHKDPGDHGIGFPCDDCQNVKYNALLYFRLDHLTVINGTKDHREHVGPDWWIDAAACHDSVTNEWVCPNEADEREGNSHPYNPDTPYPLGDYDGRNNHGGSATCQPDGNTVDCHATFDVDIYFGYVEPPIARTFWIVNTPGGDAPYHCHEDAEPCDLDGVDAP